MQKIEDIDCFLPSFPSWFLKSILGTKKQYFFPYMRFPMGKQQLQVLFKISSKKF